YRPLVERALAHRGAVLVAAVLALVASLAVTPQLGTEFLPELNEGSIWINIMLPPGISVTETSRQLARIRAMIRRLPEASTWMWRPGGPEEGPDPKRVTRAEFLFDVKPPDQWRPHLSKEDLVSEMNTALQTIPGIEPSFSQPIRDNVLDSISQI